MAELPLSTIVNVNISVSPTFPAREGFGTLLIVTNQTGVVGVSERLRLYSDIDGVIADWGANSEVTKAATTYFSQKPKPTSLMVGVRFDANQNAELIGGSVPSPELASFQALTNAGFTVAIDGVSQEITGLNFSAAASLSAVADIIETAIQAIGTGGFTAATFSYEATGFVLKSGTAGAASTLSYVTAPTSGEDVSTILKMLQGESVKADGVDAEDITTALSALNEKDDSWYGFMFTKEVRDTVQVYGETAVLAAAAWTEARVKTFFTVSNNELTKTSTQTGTIAYLLASYSRTIVLYSSYPTEYPDASTAGRAFTVDFTSGNPSITLKFKQLPGITVEKVSTVQKGYLDAVNCNAYISIAGNIMLAEGKMASGRFFDEIHGLDWLKNAIQTNVFGYMSTRTSKVPYTDKGIQALAQQVSNALAEGVTAGLLAPGTTIDDEFLSEGYKVSTVPEAKVSQSNKEARFYNGISFVALGSGAIHGVTINGIFER